MREKILIYPLAPSLHIFNFWYKERLICLFFSSSSTFPSISSDTMMTSSLPMCAPMNRQMDGLYKRLYSGDDKHVKIFIFCFCFFEYSPQNADFFPEISQLFVGKWTSWNFDGHRSPSACSPVQNILLNKLFFFSTNERFSQKKNVSPPNHSKSTLLWQNIFKFNFVFGDICRSRYPIRSRFKIVLFYFTFSLITLYKFLKNKAPSS